ncbi:hypothetical protein CAL7716_059260 [Calothrix sp. PCC 7716]|nr:hypothetical protein CAL7716_059260 [Calothrix sp. PCC 7716]
MTAVGFVLIPIGFCAAVFLSFQPVLVKPRGKVRVYDWDEHDFGVLTYSYLGYIGLLISLPYLLTIVPINNEWLSSWNKHSFEEIFSNNWNLLFLVIGIVIIPFLLILLSGMLARLFKGRKSIRPLHCSNCRSSLKKLKPKQISSYLEPPENTANQIGSTCFEGWHCPNCDSILGRSYINVRAYISSLSSFSLCNNCDEVTVKKVASVILKESTELEEGKSVDTYQCYHCSHEYSNYYSIPRKTSTLNNGSQCGGDGGHYGGDGGNSGGDCGNSGGDCGSSGGGGC